MSITPEDTERYRRRQRRRALIGWGGGLLAIAAVVVVVVAGGGGDGTQEPRPFRVPYGEFMTSAQFAEIEVGEEAADVLTRLKAGGRPEPQTKPYVLVLFPPAEEDEACTYWEFSDELAIFARLCFDTSTGDLTQKLKHDVRHPPLGGGQGTTV